MTHFEIFYIDRNTGWALAEFTIEGDQVGPASFHFHKAHAITEARALDPHKATRVFNRYGEIQKTVIGWGA